ncbi:hypothetical protein H9Q69_009141 [Fusarium xylarioides]|uniref:Protein kinase domain-containing protein n=1 Tax=Fusarium xylarioides TaxID=221167 RepID=A0A9P7L2P2_9HYPO|nr:hypothetical protein H9Q70_003775 [Fusarium xylarioides]KAG5761557.1 hypothetical protein H9Q72_010328 [Fusarium xylarioides]KAG5782841.1 hypothetical protein H9Q73_003502 [Fusarium xylarioides]KAG5791804.1 hypothetical protein H9Q69_009141 [Fusarium xylarioides]
MAEFIIGTAIGATGIILAIKGAVDGYVLIREIFGSHKETDNFTLLYEYQLIKFKTWSDRVKAHDQKTCLVVKEPKEIQDIVARTIAAIIDTQEVVGKVLMEKYKIKPISSPIPGKPGGPGAQPAFHRKSDWISHFRRERDKQKTAHPIAWAAKDKLKLKEQVELLDKFNNALEGLVRPDQYDEARVVANIVSALEKTSSLATLPTVHSNSTMSPSQDTLLSLTALIKQVQEEDVLVAASRANLIQARDLDLLYKPDASTSYSNGTYESPGKPPQQVLIEWKYVSATVQAKTQIVSRICALGTLLSTANPAEFHRLSCFGVFDDLDYEQASKGSRRIGLVYSIPRGIEMDANSPLSLLELISKRGTRPPLEVRFRLAHQLASAVALLHAANWLHKSLRSDNILFSGRTIQDANLAAPFICGFQYSRPAADTSLESRPLGQPKLDVYYHPLVGSGWNKVREVYSLGIILLEVAYWRPVFEDKYKDMTMAQVSDDIVNCLDGKFGRDLEGMVGTKFVKVINCCLKGDFDIDSRRPQDERKVMSHKFWQRVVEPLSECKA